MNRSLAPVVFACAAALPVASQAGNISLTIEGTPGSIEVQSFSFGAKQTGSFGSGGGGGGAGKAEIGQFNFSAVESAASPAMLENLVRGRHIQSARLGILDADTGAPRSEWTFTDVLVSSMSVANGEPAPKAKQPNTFLAPATTFGLTFAKFCYRIFAVNGSVARETCWDTVNNTSS